MSTKSKVKLPKYPILFIEHVDEDIIKKFLVSKTFDEYSLNILDATAATIKEFQKRVEEFEGNANDDPCVYIWMTPKGFHYIVVTAPIVEVKKTFELIS
jgi:hypothetical protein